MAIGRHRASYDRSSDGARTNCGVADDTTFGPVVVFGQGGTAVEVINDKALALPPLDLKLAQDLIARTRVSRVLRAYRDVPAADEAAVALTLVKLAQLVADVPEVKEIDLNPLLSDHSGVLALDARIAVAPLKKPAAGSRAIRASPFGLIQKNGSNCATCQMAPRCSCAPFAPRMSNCTLRFLPGSRPMTCAFGSSAR